MSTATESMTVMRLAHSLRRQKPEPGAQQVTPYLLKAAVAAVVYASLHIGPANDMTLAWLRCSSAPDVTPEQTIEGCTTIIKSDRATPDKPLDAFMLRGFAYYKKHDYARAIEDYSEAIRMEPGNAMAYNARGAAYRAMGDYDHAIQDYDYAIRLKPDYAKALNARCWARAIAGRDLQIALADCDRSLVLRPNVAETLDSRAFVYFRLGQFDRAIADDTAALAIEPRFAGARYVRGLAKRHAGDVIGGDADVAAARAIDPTIAETYAKYGVGP
jgi:tetratricopeptide (TPR) repeat protein